MVAVPRSTASSALNVFRFNGDKIVERWGRLDELGLQRQFELNFGCSDADYLV